MNQMKKDTNKNTELIINVREERLRKSKKPEHKSTIDEVKDNAKKHFEEIFNRI